MQTMRVNRPGVDGRDGITLVREWRCWREDGSYGGPCSDVLLERWVREDNMRATVVHHVDFCGWQWYVMEREM